MSTEIKPSGEGELPPTLTDQQMKIVGLANVCHAAIRAFSETMGDFTQAPWEHSPAWHQSVMVECVTFVVSKASDVNQIHEYWCDQMEKRGWKYGLVLNNDTKEHPNLKKFNDISFEEQLKYAIFMANVIAISPAMVRAPDVKLN